MHVMIESYYQQPNLDTFSEYHFIDKQYFVVVPISLVSKTTLGQE